MEKKQHFGIGALSAQTGVIIETIRYYEHEGLMPAPPRTAGGHRSYSEDHLKRLTFIRRCRELGFSMAEIRGLLALVDGGSYTIASRDRRLIHHKESQPLPVLLS